MVWDNWVMAFVLVFALYTLIFIMAGLTVWLVRHLRLCEQDYFDDYYDG